MRRRDVNWDEVRHVFVTAPVQVTLGEIAGQYGVSEAWVQKRSAREGWVTQKEAYRQQVDSDALQKAAEMAAQQRAERLVQVAEMYGQAAQRLLEIVLAKITPEQMDATDVAKFLRTDSAMLIQRLLTAAAIATDKERLIVGLPTERTAISTQSDGAVLPSIRELTDDEVIAHIRSLDVVSATLAGDGTDQARDRAEGAA